jgi:hypothetical protein
MPTWLREVIDDAQQRYSEGTLPLSDYAEREIARIRRQSEREMEPVCIEPDVTSSQRRNEER